MNYQDFVLKHRQTRADITVAALPTDEKKATAFGLMKIDDKGQIIDFAEKPKGEALRAMEVDTSILGLDPERCDRAPLRWLHCTSIARSLSATATPPWHFWSDLICSPHNLQSSAIWGGRAKKEPYIASMGIYVLKASAVRDLLLKHFPEVGLLLPVAQRLCI